MFSIKWIADNGSEMLYRGGNVSYSPAKETESGKAVVHFEMDGGVGCSIDSGRVYVMNDRGCTVADYILQTENFPDGLAPRQAA